MCGQSDAPRVGNPLTVKDKEVRPDRQSLKCAQNAWAFPKREQAGDVREGSWCLAHRAVHRLQVRELENDHGRPRHASADTDIHSCHGPHLRWIERCLRDDPPGQLGLKGLGLGG